MILLPLGFMAAAAPAPLLLDTLAVPPVFAVSTRRLRAAYAGPALRVRRATDNAEQDIGFTGAGDLDAAALLAFCGGGSGFVARWHCQAAGGPDLVGATAAQQPRLVASGALLRFGAGRPAAPNWGAAANSLAAALTGGGAALQAVCAAVDSCSNPDARLLSFTAAGDAGDDATAGSCALLLNADPGFDNTVATRRNGAATYAAGPRVFAAAYDGATGALWVDGVAQGSFASAGAFGASGTLRLGAGAPGGTWTGPVGEAVLQGA